jgi:hypothetical protein
MLAANPLNENDPAGPIPRSEPAGFHGTLEMRFNPQD